MTDDLIDIPAEVDEPRVLSDSRVTAYDGLVGQVVRFNDLDPIPCWAHTTDRDSCGGRFSDCLHHGCHWDGDGRLGLCLYHEKEILG